MDEQEIQLSWGCLVGKRMILTRSGGISSVKALRSNDSTVALILPSTWGTSGSQGVFDTPSSLVSSGVPRLLGMQWFLPNYRHFGESGPRPVDQQYEKSSILVAVGGIAHVLPHPCASKSPSVVGRVCFDCRFAIYISFFP